MAFRNGKAACTLCSTGTTPTPPVVSDTLEAVIKYAGDSIPGFIDPVNMLDESLGLLAATIDHDISAKMSLLCPAANEGRERVSKQDQQKEHRAKP
jgi:hypothetical protein